MLLLVFFSFYLQSKVTKFCKKALHCALSSIADSSFCVVDMPSVYVYPSFSIMLACNLNGNCSSICLKSNILPSTSAIFTFALDLPSRSIFHLLCFPLLWRYG